MSELLTVACRYEPEVDPALYVIFKSAYFGEEVTALVYSNGRIVYTSRGVKYIQRADQLLRTGRKKRSATRTAASAASTTSSTSSNAGAASASTEAGNATAASGAQAQRYYPESTPAERKQLPLLVRYRHPFARQSL